MGPRRILVVLFALALAALVATAGVAVASEGRGPGRGHAAGADKSDHGGHGPRGKAGVERNGESDDAATSDVDGAAIDVSVHVGSGISGGVTFSGSGQGNDVTETGVDAPPAPVEAPAVAASGPAPDAATAAPVTGAVADAFVATVRTPDASGGDVPATATASATEPAPPTVPEPQGLEGLPVLGSLGDVADRVSDGSSAARTFLSSAPPHSLAVVALLLVAIALFLSFHRWADRGDRKLAAARRGPDLARFR